MRAAVLLLTAVALATGCGGTASPAAAPDLSLQNAWLAAHVRHDPAWMARGAAKQNLLYISLDSFSNSVDVITYPQGESVGILTQPVDTQGLCADKSGNVYVTSFIASSSYAEGNVYVYAHGSTKPMRVLHDGDAAPMGCSVDPITGNLAVTNQCSGSSCAHGSVAIFAQAKGTPKLYSDSNFVYYYYCGYDNSGNLFVDGYGSKYGTFRFAELPKGGSKFANISLQAKIAQPGGVQWDGRYITVANAGGPIYRTSGTSGKIAGSTTLLGPGNIGPVRIEQYWIAGTTIVGPGSIVGLWHYPSGGKPFKVLAKHFTAVGAVVSFAQ